MDRRLLIALLGLAGLVACTTPPAEPDYDNPFDPGTPGDPFQLTATLEGAGIRLIWEPVEIPGLARYVVLRSDSPDDGFFPTDTQPQVVGDNLLTTILDTDYIPNAPNFYKVRAVGPGETLTALSRTVAVGVTPPPLVSLAGAAEATATRFVMLEARTGFGVALEIANQEDFSDAQSFDVTEPNEVITTAWTLPTVEHPDSNLVVYVRADQGGTFSATGTWDVDVAFQPRPVLVGGNPLSVLDSLVTVQWDDEGLVRFRLAASRDGLEVEPWQPADSLAIRALDPTDFDPQTVFGQFEGDFGYTTIDSLVLTPESQPSVLTGLVLSGGDSTTVESTILVEVQGTDIAYLRLSEDPAFTGVDWVPFESPIEFELSPGAGRKTVYARARHAWDPVGDGASASITRLAKRPR